MAQKIKPVKRSLVSHQRVDHIRKLTSFVDSLVEGALDAEIQEIADHADPEVVKKHPKIEDLIEQLRTLATGDMKHDVEMLNTFVDDHHAHPQSILLLREMVHILRDGLDAEQKEALKVELMQSLSERN